MYPSEDGEGSYYVAEGTWDLLGADPSRPKCGSARRGVFGWLRGVDLNPSPALIPRKLLIL